jgi:predicted dehydrogenase
MNDDNFILADDIKRVAIIGCGNVASTIDDGAQRRHIFGHAKAISLVKQLKITACCDIDENRLKTFAERWGVPGQYLDLQDMLRKERIDILTIATPTRFHYENVLAILSSDVRAIFCEKPLTFSTEQGLELVRKAKESKKLLVVNYMRRWDKFYARCKVLLESGELGKIETIVAYVDTALYMNSSHMLDMLLYFGGDVTSCVGYIDRLNETRVVHGEKDFGGMALFKHKNGIITFIKATGESRRNHFFELDIQCTRGRLRILDDDTKYEIYRFKESPQHKGLDELALAYTKANDEKSERVVNAYLDILDCISNDKEPAYSAVKALKSLEMIELIYKSDAGGNVPVYARLPEIV